MLWRGWNIGALTVYATMNYVVDLEEIVLRCVSEFRPFGAWAFGAQGLGCKALGL